jgi:ABC-type uncharacterized transport system permease subunit
MARPLPRRRSRLREIAIILVAVVVTFVVGRVLVVTLQYPPLWVQLVLLLVLYVAATSLLTRASDRFWRR